MRDLQRSQMAVVNEIHTEANAIMKILHTPKVSLFKIELLVCGTVLLLTLGPMFGWSRRCHGWSRRCHNFSSYVITFTLGLMHETSFRTELFPVWAAFLVILFRSLDSSSAYSLEDKVQLFENILFGGLLIMHARMSPMMLGVVMIWVVLCLFLTVQFIYGKAMSLITASGYGIQRTTKLIANYMSSEHRLSAPHELNPIQMTGYKYVVRGDEGRWENVLVIIFKKLIGREAAAQMEAPKYRKSLEITDEIITVEKVWKCEGSLLSSTGGDKDGKFKDICLSFSLYKLLSLRFCSYPLPKEAHEKAWKLIRDGLLVEENGYERALRVIELELYFLFQMFYTKYPIIFQPGLWQLKVMELLFLVIGSLAMIGLCLVWYKWNRPQDEVHLATLGGLSSEVFITLLILIVFTIVELVQLFLMAISEWAKVLLLCKYVRTNSWQNCKLMEMLIGLICRAQLQKPWKRILRQYSLLESHGYTPPRSVCIPAKAGYIHRVREGKKQSAPAKLSSEVKQAVFHSLKSNPGVLENGVASLRLNKVAGKLSWACRLETQTRVIIVWHIATSICEHEVRISDSNFLVATTLSKYLAYLVVFSPKLLPDCPDDTEYFFDQTILQSRDMLTGCKTGDERIRKLKEIGKTVDGTGSVIYRGAQLGQQLLKDKKDPKFIWKVLAEFWAELMVYVAPSDDAKAHAENLAMGGEFVTHLWALVSLAGIKREPPVEQSTLKRCRSWSN